MRNCPFLVPFEESHNGLGWISLAAGFVGVTPALGLLDYKHDGANPIKVGVVDGILWGCAVALFGYAVNIVGETIQF